MEPLEDESVRAPEPGAPPVLSYQDPLSRKKERPRTRSFRLGVVSIWVSSIVCVPMLFTTGNVGWLQALGGSAIVLVATGIARVITERHARFLLGLLVGALTVLGTSALAVVILCGK